MVFKNRKDAGLLLAKHLSAFHLKNPLVLALPRGGVPVGAEVSAFLQASLDVFIVRKIGAPNQPELAVGALAEDGSLWWNEDLLHYLGLKPGDLDEINANESKKIQKQIKLFRDSRKLENLAGRTVVLVDDGLATGATIHVAIKSLKKQGVARIIVAVPISSKDSAWNIRNMGVELVAVVESESFSSVGAWYEDFSQVEDEEVINLLKKNEKDSSFKNSQKKQNISLVKNKKEQLIQAIADNLYPIRDAADFGPLLKFLEKKRVVMLGESTHGTSEFYQIRAQISQKLLSRYGFNFVAVEGDWPDASHLNSYIETGKGESAQKLMQKFHRWPTWMWANQEVADFIEGLRSRKAVGFYGLDVYSLFESMDYVVEFLKKNDPFLARAVQTRYACFAQFARDEYAYARSLLHFPEGCASEVLESLNAMLRLKLKNGNAAELFNAQQNARIAVNAENYYRTMLTGDEKSWNVRDSHMLDTFDALLENEAKKHNLAQAKGIIWAHNTHIGDYRATDMAKNQYVNIGGLARLSYGKNEVALVGFSTYRGEVVASNAWGSAEQIMTIPPAQEDSYEDYFHEAMLLRGFKQAYILLNSDLREGPLSEYHGQRAIGVVYDSRHEKRGNYVPTSLASRYDAFVFLEETSALHSLHSAFRHGEIPETWPLGM